MAPRNTALTIKEKLLVISKWQKGEMTKKKLAVEFRCDISTINRIIRNECKIREIAASNKNLKLKRLRKSNYADVEKALTLWFNQMRAQNAVISSQMIMNKAKAFAVKLNSDFEPNCGWLWRWQKRENIKFSKTHGESNENDSEGAKTFLESSNFLSILKNYTPKNIFNADESGLLYKSLPCGTFVRRGEIIKGNKSQKQRITLLFLCNSLGTYKKVFTIGKFRKPRCFKGKSNLPVPYFSNKNAWMTNSLWVTIMEQLDREMIKLGRKIVLFVDNASCHKFSGDLQNVNIQFLPPNITALIQPLDQGIIHSFKANYRQIIIRKQIISIENGCKLQEFIKSITVLDALNYIKRAWWLVKAESITNCFQKAGFLTQMQPIAESDENCIDVTTVIDNFEEYVDCDANLECYGLLNDDEILNELNEDNTGDILSEDEIVPVEEQTTPSLKEAFQAVDVLRRFFVYKKYDSEDIENLEALIFANEVPNMTQSKITEYFK